MLDMGEPVRIMDLATDLIRLSGRDVGRVPIQITGLGYRVGLSIVAYAALHWRWRARSSTRICILLVKSLRV